MFPAVARSNCIHHGVFVEQDHGEDGGRMRPSRNTSLARIAAWLMPAFLTGKDKDEMLTGREREILQLLADGMSNQDVAAKLFISQETVKSHVRHILAKLEADTRTQAVAIALREAIID